MEEREEIDDGKNGKEEEPGDAGGEETAEGVLGPEDGEGEIERKKREEEDAAVRDAGEIEEAGLVKFGGYGGGFEGLCDFAESEETSEGDKVEEDKPDEREGELEVHGGVGAEGDDGVVREKEDGGEEVEKAPEELVEKGLGISGFWGLAGFGRFIDGVEGFIERFGGFIGGHGFCSLRVLKVF